MEEEEEGLFREEIDKGDEFMAVKPWLGAIKSPSDYVKSNNMNKVPRASLALDYVFGYRAKDCRNNVKVLHNGCLVYHAAALGIVLDVDTNTQQFFNCHTDDITAMDMASDGVTIATGEVGPKPYIFIWNADTREVVAEFKGVILKGISNLSFSPSGNTLVASAIDDDHHIAVINVPNKTVTTTFKSGRDIILCI